MTKATQRRECLFWCSTPESYESIKVEHHHSKQEKHWQEQKIENNHISTTNTKPTVQTESRERLYISKSISNGWPFKPPHVVLPNGKHVSKTSEDYGGHSSFKVHRMSNFTAILENCLEAPYEIEHVTYIIIYLCSWILFSEEWN